MTNKKTRTRMREAREDKTCHYCPRPATTVDHIIPRALGGSNRYLNLVPSCQECNSDKADQLPLCQCLKCTLALEAYNQREEAMEDLRRSGYHAVTSAQLMAMVRCTKCGAVVASIDKKLHEEFHAELIQVFGAWGNVLNRLKEAAG